jgi:hypothetical protein
MLSKQKNSFVKLLTQYIPSKKKKATKSVNGIKANHVQI